MMITWPGTIRYLSNFKLYVGRRLAINHDVGNGRRRKQSTVKYRLEGLRQSFIEKPGKVYTSVNFAEFLIYKSAKSFFTSFQFFLI